MEDEATQRTNVLLEDIRAQQRAMFEGMLAMEERIIDRFELRFSSSEQRATFLDDVLHELRSR